VNIEEMTRFREVLTRFDSVVLVGHRNADGDCLGVMSALASVAHRIGSPTRLLVSDPIPPHLGFLAHLNRAEVVTEADCRGGAVVFLECGTPERSGIVVRHPGFVVNLDHHPDNTGYGDLLLLDPTASSIGEMVTGFMDAMFDESWTPDIADALYAAIHTDTGGFSFGNTSQRALSAAALLVSRGARPGEVCTRIYQENEMPRLRLLGKLLTSLETRQEGLFAVGIITGEDLAAVGAGPADTDNFSNWTRDIRGVQVGIFLLEQPDGSWKVSLRSKGNWVVNRAAAAMGGGGHAAAAGFRTTGDPRAIVDRVIGLIQQHHEESDLSH